MNQEQIVSLVRTLLQFAGGIAVGKGWLDQETAVAVTGALVTLVATAWSLYARRDASLIAATARLTQVHRIVADRPVADAIPDAKVQPRR